MTTYAQTDQDMLDVLAGEMARDAAFAMLDDADYRDETKAILRVIVATAHDLDVFSANDVRKRLPDDTHQPRIGRCFGLAGQLGLIEHAGYVKSSKKNTHAKPVGTYRRVLDSASP